MIALFLLFLAGSGHAVFIINPNLQTANASLLDLCPYDSLHCTELGPDETCYSRGSEQTQRYNTEICNHHLTDASFQASECDFGIETGLSELEALCPLTEECVNHTAAAWPVLTYSLIHYSRDTLSIDSFIVSIHWELPPGVSVSGYSLTVSQSEWSCPVGSDPYLHCGTTQLTADSKDFLYTHDGYHLNEALKDGNLYIKVTPHGWCDGPQLSLVIPETCHSICPGACSTCRDDNPPPPPIDVTVSLCRSPDTEMGVATVAWKPGRMYFEAYPNQTYYLAVFRKDENKPISRHIEIVGQTQVTLHNLLLDHHQEYFIKVWSFDCQCGFESARAELSMSTDTPHCLNTVTTSSTLGPSYTPSQHIKSTSVTQLPLSLHTPLPTSTSSQGGTVSFHYWLHSLLIFIVAVFVILVIIIGLVIYRSRQTVKSHSLFHDPKTTLPSPQPLTTQILLVYSLKTPTDEIEDILRNFAAPLQLYGIEVIFYDTVCGRMGLPQWMESAVSNSSKVFLVCNEQFKMEWEDSSSKSFEGNLVHILKQNFFAHVRTSSDYMSKYALLFMGSDERCIVSSYLHNLQQFVVDPNLPSALEEVARFITNTKSYIIDIGV